MFVYLGTLQAEQIVQALDAAGPFLCHVRHCVQGLHGLSPADIEEPKLMKCLELLRLIRDDVARSADLKPEA